MIPSGQSQLFKQLFGGLSLASCNPHLIMSFSQSFPFPHSQLICRPWLSALLAVALLLCPALLKLEPAARAQSYPVRATMKQALAVLVQQRGSRIGEQIIAVRGFQGQAQPTYWEFEVLDPQSRSLSRIVRVANGQIYYDKPPATLVSRDQPPPMINMTRFRMDSDRAFAIANEHAQKARIAFNYVSYNLIPHSQDNRPIWIVRLFDNFEDEVGRVDLDASSGTVVFKEFDEDRQLTADGKFRSNEEPEEGAPLERAGRNADRVFDRIGDGFRRIFRRDR